MIIVCSGPDTYRARQRARELVLAFKQKHDPNSLSTFILATGQDIKTILSDIGTPSLFTTKKLIKCDGLLATLKIAEVRTLMSKLQIDGDQTILLTVEDEPPSDKILEILKPAPLFFYPFPFLRGSAFLKWIIDEAQKLGVSKALATEIAAYAESDTWYARQELNKKAVYPDAEQVSEKNTVSSSFETIENFLQEKKGSREQLKNLKDESMISLMQSQIKSYIRVRDGFTEGMHPYVQKKMKQLKIRNVEQKLLKSIKALSANRNGLSAGNEIESLI